MAADFEIIRFTRYQQTGEWWMRCDERFTSPVLIFHETALASEKPDVKVLTQAEAQEVAG